MCKSEATTVENLNKHLVHLEDDYLYHISLGKNVDNLEEMFGDLKVKFGKNFTLIVTILSFCYDTSLFVWAEVQNECISSHSI